MSTVGIKLAESWTHFTTALLRPTRSMPKRKAYTVREKLELITCIRNGESQAKVARETSIAESTLRGWLKWEGALRQYADGLQDEDGLKRKKQRTAKDPVLDTAMVNWFTQECQTGLPISGPMVKAQAEIFNKSINGDDTEFVASQGWLWRWQKRHGITKHKIVGEKRSADKDGAAQFPPRLLKFLADNQLVDEQIYNADESGLFYRMLANSTLAQKNDTTKTEGYKLVKDRVTLLFCVNKTGTHMMKPLCIGKFAKPRCFSHINMNTLSLAYTNSGNAWMTAKIFQEWFQCTFVPAVRRHMRQQSLDEKAVLLLDNCRAHPPAHMLRSANGKITVMYMPPNTTSIIQPFDQGIISAFKRHYRTELVKEILLSDANATEFLKKFYLKEMFRVAGELGTK